MKPSYINYICAHGFKIITISGGLAGIVFILTKSCFNIDFVKNPVAVILLVVALFTAIPLGCLFGIFIIWPFTYAICAKINGAPFREGDCVQVLVGDFKNKCGCIYEIWSSRNQVRVDLGIDAKEKVIDVFSYNEVFRIKSADNQSSLK